MFAATREKVTGVEENLREVEIHDQYF